MPRRRASPGRGHPAPVGAGRRAAQERAQRLCRIRAGSGDVAALSGDVGPDRPRCHRLPGHPRTDQQRGDRRLPGREDRSGYIDAVAMLRTAWAKADRYARSTGTGNLPIPTPPPATKRSNCCATPMARRARSARPTWAGPDDGRIARRPRCHRPARAHPRRALTQVPRPSSNNRGHYTSPIRFPSRLYVPPGRSDTGPTLIRITTPSTR